MTNTGCYQCNEAQRISGSSTAMCGKCETDMAEHEYMVSKKRVQKYALARAQTENNYEPEREGELKWQQ